MASNFVIVGSRVSSAEKGLSLFSFDEATGQLTLTGSYSGIEMPTYQVFNKKASLLYSVSEILEKEGSVQTFKVDPSSPTPFTPTHSILTGGTSPCHLSLSPDNSFLAVSNYSDGVFTLYALDPEGTIATVVSHKSFKGVGHNPARQEGPHIHSSNWTVDSKNLFVADLGLDRIIHYTKPEWGFPSFKKLPLGSGPRHMVLTPDGRFLYIGCELSNQVLVYQIDKYDSCFTHLQTIPTLPALYHLENTVADIHLSSDNRFLYCSNRGHDSIATYAVKKGTGMLSLVSITPTLGKEPRNFTLSPSGRWLLAANGSSDSVVVFPLDAQTGVPLQAVCTVAVRQPVCLLFS